MKPIFPKKIDNKTLLIIAALAALLLSGYVFYTGQLTLPKKIQKQTLPQKPTVLSLTLNEQNKSKEAGVATLKDAGGKLVVTLGLSGAPKGVSQPAHIRLGSCTKPGNLKYPLSSVVDGKSETTLNITLAKLVSERPLAISVYRSAKDTKAFVSCGDIPGY